MREIEKERCRKKEIEETSKDLLVSRILEHTVRCGVCAVRLGKR